ncbi:hypothetical protein S122051_0081 [Staphylococcus aureus subsp. aureus 122051]|nr:hypothetical protein S122051_0081 [Staphylococcus aureus subsp. aureus 122051]QGQ74939.1 hypothetical protein SAST44_01746 [Staphylococcus aureus]QGQ78276.1 hypothetical protein SAST45_01720 [Staphylococcus aureus]
MVVACFFTLRKIENQRESFEKYELFKLQQKID